MIKSPECPKCQKKMETGHIPDVGYGVITQGTWTSGAAEQRRFLGGIKYDKKRQVPITAYRCSRCGFLELYAT
jgi:hypothetical protein